MEKERVTQLPKIYAFFILLSVEIYQLKFIH